MLLLARAQLCERMDQLQFKLGYLIRKKDRTARGFRENKRMEGEIRRTMAEYRMVRQLLESYN
jgi:hypothetical protein